MTTCKKCGNEMPQKRKELGFQDCVNCSSTEKYSGVPVNFHKTGNIIQVVKDPEVAKEFMKLSYRAGFTAFQGTRPIPEEKEPNFTSEHFPPQASTPLSKVLKRTLDTSNYDDENISKIALERIKHESKEEVVKFINNEFQLLHLSPNCRKRLLIVIETFSTLPN